MIGKILCWLGIHDRAWKLDIISLCDEDGRFLRDVKGQIGTCTRCGNAKPKI